MTVHDVPELYTPEELEEHFGTTPTGRKKLAAYEMRRMVREGRVTATRGPRNAVLFTTEQARAMLDALLYTAATKAPEGRAAAGKPAAAAPQGGDTEAHGFRTSRRRKPRARA